MTATRIRETADGVLYRLSEPVEYNFYELRTADFNDAEGPILSQTEYVLVRRRGTDYMQIVATDNTGAVVKLSEDISITLGIHNPDAMIEAMGYTVLQEDA